MVGDGAYAEKVCASVVVEKSPSFRYSSGEYAVFPMFCHAVRVFVQTLLPLPALYCGTPLPYKGKRI